MMGVLMRVFDYSKRYIKPFICFLIFLRALYLRFLRLATRELWNDEIFQLVSVRNQEIPFWRRPSYGEFISFPGDYTLNYFFVKIFGASENKWGLAIPHIIVTIIGFYFLYLLCNRYFKTIWGYIIAFAVVCMNTMLIFHAFEFRPYAVLPTLSLASFYFSETIVCRYRQLSAIKKFLIGIFFVLVICFHFFGIFIVFFTTLFFVLNKLPDQSFRANFKDILKFFTIILLITVPYCIWYTLGNPLQTTKETFDAINTFQYIPNPILNIIGFLKAIFGNLIGERKLYFLLAGFGISLLIPYREKLKQFGFFFILIVLPIELICLGAVLRGYVFVQRQFVWVMPLFAFLLGWQWDSLAYFVLERLKMKDREVKSL